VESSWSDDVGELEKCWTQLDDVKRRQVELMIDADNERKQVCSHSGRFLSAVFTILAREKKTFRRHRYDSDVFLAVSVPMWL